MSTSQCLTCSFRPPGSPTDAGSTTSSVTVFVETATPSTSPGSIPLPTASSGASTQSSALAPTTEASSSTTTLAESSTAIATASSTSNAGVIAGSVIGGVVFLVLVVLGTLLYLRARKRKRTPPSSEFINSIRDGAAPVLRLDSGAEYTAALAEKGGGYTHYPPTPPPPFTHSYYSSPPMLDMKFTDEIMMTDIPSERPSVEKPLHPQRFSSPDSFVARYRPTTSIGSRRELWGSDNEMHSGELSPVRQSLTHPDSVLQFATRFSPSPQPSHPSHSPPPLCPLRRQPDSEGT